MAIYDGGKKEERIEGGIKSSSIECENKINLTIEISKLKKKKN